MGVRVAPVAPPPTVLTLGGTPTWEFGADDLTHVHNFARLSEDYGKAGDEIPFTSLQRYCSVLCAGCGEVREVLSRKDWAP